ncbi:hypothetical protein DMENIID0001_159300 [Sergentomyia squamirostris]
MFADAWKAEEDFLKKVITISDLTEGRQYKICSPPFIPSLEELQEIKGGGTPRWGATERWRTALVDEYDALYPPRQRHDSNTDDDETVDLKEEKRLLQELLKIVDTKIGKKELVTYIVVAIKSG